MGEFELIRRFFAEPAAGQVSSGPGLIQLGIGDDCALLGATPDQSEVMAVSTDTLVAGRHFYPEVAAADLGHKALAVNLSDLAAMGARPIACLLALALPQRLAGDTDWLQAFSSAWHALGARYACPLIGGDTVQMPDDGPLTLTVTVLGGVPRRQALRRDAARPGDLIWVSGELGLAYLGYRYLRAQRQTALARALDEPAPAADPDNDGLDAAFAEALAAMSTIDQQALIDAVLRPQPRVELGLALRGLAHAALDVSDGLAGDLRHIAERSHVDLDVNLAALPMRAAVAALPPRLRWQAVAAGGDAYELAFTAPQAHSDALLALAQRLRLPLTPIGLVRDCQGDTPSLTWLDDKGVPVDLHLRGFDHFTPQNGDHRGD